MFRADFHIHSPYSRATSKALSFETLYEWGRKKGVSLIGTGDCTHPSWINEIETKLDYTDNGLFKLKSEFQPELDGELNTTEDFLDIRFMLTGEISTIYKCGDKTRKVHHVVCLPDLDTAKVFNRKLQKIGNIVSDGRPILGLDSNPVNKSL